MRRVAVTGLGAITPIGNDAPATWRAAVAGESGIDFIRSFDASAFPVRIAAEVKDFDPTTVASPKEVRKLDRNVLLALGAAKEGSATPGSTPRTTSGASASSWAPPSAASPGFWGRTTRRRAPGPTAS